jgi:hypothetical protein
MNYKVQRIKKSTNKYINANPLAEKGNTGLEALAGRGGTTPAKVDLLNTGHNNRYELITMFAVNPKITV